MRSQTSLLILSFPIGTTYLIVNRFVWWANTQVRPYGFFNNASNKSPKLDWINWTKFITYIPFCQEGYYFRNISSHDNPYIRNKLSIYSIIEWMLTRLIYFAFRSQNHGPGHPYPRRERQITARRNQILDALPRPSLKRASFAQPPARLLSVPTWLKDHPIITSILKMTCWLASSGECPRAWRSRIASREPCPLV